MEMKERPVHPAIKAAPAGDSGFFLKKGEEALPYMRGVRRHFHMYPEPSLHEEATSLKIREELDAMGIKWELVEPYGVVATIEGSLPGKTVALRADTDALKIQENGNAPYKSRKDGFMHACGHDAHMAMLLGAARILNGCRDRIKGKVKLVFQEAEEIGAGAVLMLRAGKLSDCGAIFGLHQSAEYKTGEIMMGSRDFTAANVIFTVVVKGKGAHGSKPHQSIDPVLTASAIIGNLQSIVSREIDPDKRVVLSVGYVSSKTCRCNIITDEVEFGGTIRFFDSDLKKPLEDAFRRVVDNTAAAFRAKAEVMYANVCVPVYNDPELARLAKSSLSGLVGAERVHDGAKIAAAEDFAFYQQQLPGFYFFLGSGDENHTSALHSPDYDINEDVLAIGAAAHCLLATDYLNSVG